MRTRVTRALSLAFPGKTSVMFHVPGMEAPADAEMSPLPVRSKTQTFTSLYVPRSGDPMILQVRTAPYHWDDWSTD